MVNPSPREPSALVCVTTGSGVAFFGLFDEWGSTLGRVVLPFSSVSWTFINHFLI
jgi:hypothetical protein